MGLTHHTNSFVAQLVLSANKLRPRSLV